MITYEFLQHYWWLLISVLGALLVFLLFVQGGQGLLYTIGKTPAERKMIADTLGSKWEITFTTLVTFGGAFFASFPLFYSTSFGGAFYVWMLILIVFVIQAVSYEYRRKPNNFLGEKTFDAFLVVNGIAGALLLGVAVGTLFTGANFIVEKGNLANIGGSTVISQWQSPWRGLEALADYRNVALGLAVLFLSRVLGLQYFMKTIDDETVYSRSRKHLLYNAVPFLIFFLLFFVSLLFSKGWAVDPQTGVISIEDHKYLNNLLQMPLILGLLLVGVLSVLWSLVTGLFKGTGRNAIWFGGVGTFLTVCCLLLCAGWNNTAYYPSLVDPQSSLTIYNSSSSEFTLKTMSVVSLVIPFVIAYIWYAWHQLTRRKITRPEGDEEGAY